MLLFYLTALSILVRASIGVLVRDAGVRLGSGLAGGEARFIGFLGL